ncbi:hypothetical protein NLX30_05180 [Burkholderia arboris]|nr:hypothetical protein [Burkholderia arboris]UTV55777.1 hypothetical protein NLX30_05180 [Burkholderia arboris]
MRSRDATAAVIAPLRYGPRQPPRARFGHGCVDVEALLELKRLTDAKTVSRNSHVPDQPVHDDPRLTAAGAQPAMPRDRRRTDGQFGQDHGERQIPRRIACST